MQINITDIFIPKRLREVNPKKVFELANSIEESGLLHPIIVCENNSHFKLICGAHRLEAFKYLKKKSIESKIVDKHYDIELIEIDENLIRNELSILEKGEHLLRRDEILQKKGLRALKGQNRYFRHDTVTPLTSKDISEKIGTSERSYQRYKQIARNIIPELRKKIHGTEIENQTRQLIQISRLSYETQSKIVNNDIIIESFLQKPISENSNSKLKKKYKIQNHFSIDFKCDGVIYYGDCRDLLKEIPSQTVQLILTSPPYNLGKEYEEKLSIDKYLSLHTEVISECDRVLKKSGSICWQIGDYYKDNEIVPLDILYYPIFKYLGYKLINRIIWHYGFGGNSTKKLSRRYETILWWVKSDNYLFNLDDIRVPHKNPGKVAYKGTGKGNDFTVNPLGKNPSDVWNISNVKAGCKEYTNHPAQFPEELARKIILGMSNKGDYILDPYLGSGSTSVVGLKTGRKVIGAEIKKEYQEIIRKRLNI